MAPPKKKSSSGRATAKKNSPAETKPAVTVAIDSGNKTLSPKQLDMVRAASGWSLSELFDTKTQEPTGKFMAARIWLLIRDYNPNVTPQEIYDTDLADMEKYGVEIIHAEGPVDPTSAAS